MPPTHKISILANALANDARTSISYAARYGFSGIAFNSILGPLDLTTLSDTGIREFQHLLTNHHLELVALCSATGPAGLGPDADLDQLLSRLDAVMQLAVKLGTPLVSLDVGLLPSAPKPRRTPATITPAQAGLIFIPPAQPVASHAEPDTEPPSAQNAAQTAALYTALDALCQKADRYGCTLALHSERSDFASLAQALAGISCPWLGVDLDTAALVADRWDCDRVFDELGPLIHHVRARDALRGNDGRSSPAPIGHGQVDWPQLLANLSSDDYKGFLTIDPLNLPDRLTGAITGRSALLTMQQE